MPRKKEHKSINTHKKIARVPTFIQNACKSAKGKINIAKLKYNVPQVKSVYSQTLMQFSHRNPEHLCPHLRLIGSAGMRCVR